jgi:hypothetical protein
MRQVAVIAAALAALSLAAGAVAGTRGVPLTGAQARHALQSHYLDVVACAYDFPCSGGPYRYLTLESVRASSLSPLGRGVRGRDGRLRWRSWRIVACGRNVSDGARYSGTFAYRLTRTGSLAFPLHRSPYDYAVFKPRCP